MRIIQQIAFYFLLLMTLNACEDTPTVDNQDSVEEPDSATTEVPTEPATVPLDLSNATIRFHLQNEQEDEMGMPKADLLLSVGEDTVLLTNDVRGVEVDKSYYASFGIPTEAALAIECYWAGGGHYYYVLVDNHEVTVYKGFIGEPDPEVEAPEPASQYTPFKRFSFYETEIVEEELQPSPK
jgi:hypothetical protein